jgi:CubicO group peptidase (beta-lactamase class C family)
VKRWVAIGLVLSAALLLAGCRDGADGDSEPDTTTSTLASAAPSSEPEGEPPQFDRAALDRLAAHAKAAGSNCFLVAQRGHVLGEWYWKDSGPDAAQEVFSVTKSVTSTLVGIAQAEGSLDVDDPASTWIPEWRRTDSEDVTVRNLLSNDSGRYWTPASDYGSLIRAQDRTAYAVGLGQQFEPGTVWAYNNAAIQTLDAVLHGATGEETADYAAERLLGPLGMTHTRYTKDGSGRSTQAFFGMQSTCPDLARFGRIFAQGGVWNGEQLVPAGWVADATGRSSQRLNAAYGLLWWVNRKGPLRSPLDSENPGLPPGVETVGRLAPGAPGDLFAALGFGGQVVLVDPASQTVVVRLGVPGDPESRDYTFADAARVVTEVLRPAP